MSVFTDEEREYLHSGVRLGRLATVGPDGAPHVVPTSFRFSEEHDTIDIGGHDFATRKKYRDVGRNPKVAFVIDDLASVNPWRVRGIEIRGQAEILETGGADLGPGFAPQMFRITPAHIVNWGPAWRGSASTSAGTAQSACTTSPTSPPGSSATRSTSGPSPVPSSTASPPHWDASSR
jgi:pyridoxamine 5'-phosphate oxidase family protein